MAVTELGDSATDNSGPLAYFILRKFIKINLTFQVWLIRPEPNSMIR